MSEEFLSDSTKRHSSAKEFNRINSIPVARVEMLPESLTFGYLDLGQLSAVQTVTVINTGDRDVTVTEIDITTDYDKSHPDLPITLKHDESFTIEITFLPQSSGPKNGTLSINAGAVNGNTTVKLFGTGTTETYIPPDESLKAQAAAIGISPSDSNLGLFSGGILPANINVKTALQALSNYSTDINDNIGVINDNLFNINDEFTIKTDALLQMANDVQAQADQLVEDILALGGEVDTLETTVSTQGSSIGTLQTSVTNALGSLALQEITLNAHDASITSTLTAVSSLELNMASMETELSSTNATVITQGSAISSLEGDFATLNSSVSTIGSTVETQATAISTIDSELANLETNLSTAIGNNTAAINIQATTLNGVQARYGVKLDVNGHITGWVANNNGSTGGIDFVNDYFRIWNTTGSLSRAPFEFVSGELYIKSAHIGNLSIDSTKIANGAVTTGKIGDSQVTSGKLGSSAVTTEKIAVNSITEVDFADYSTFNLSATTHNASIANYVIAKPSGTALIRITMSANVRLGTAAGVSEMIRFSSYLQIEGGAVRRNTFQQEVFNSQYSYTEINMTYLVDASLLANGDEVDLQLEWAQASIVDVQVTLPQIVVEYVKR